MTDQAKRFLFTSLILLILTIVVNFLANYLPINNITTGEISALYDNLFVPSGWTFSIWSLIYIGLLVYTIYPFILLNKGRGEELKNVMAGAKWFWVSCLVNMAWIFTWHYEILLLSVVLMVILLIALINLWKIHFQDNESSFFKIPVSVYFGWITVATIANFAAFFTSMGWEADTGQAAFITILMLSVAFLLGLYFLFSKRDIYYVLVLIWAFTGIAGKQMAGDVMVWIMATTYIVLLSVFMVSSPIKKLLDKG